MCTIFSRILALLTVGTRQRKRCAAEALRAAYRPGGGDQRRAHHTSTDHGAHHSRKRVVLTTCTSKYIGSEAPRIAGARHNRLIQEWPFPIVSFSSALEKIWGPDSELCCT